MSDGFETGVLLIDRGFLMGVPIVLIVENVVFLLMEALGSDIVCWWSVRYSVVGLRVFLMIYIRSFVRCWSRSSQQLLPSPLQPFLTTSPRYSPSS